MIYPEGVWNPGRNAGYRAGRTSMTTAVCHYTVGRSSAGIGLQGYFTFLVSRDGTVEQYAEADAVTWHAGDPWNSRGPGVEVEYLPGWDDELWTPEQERAVARLCTWLKGLGITDAFYDGARVGAWDGFITHRSLIQSGDAHNDFWPYLPTITPPALPPEDDMRLFHDTATDLWWLATSNAMIQCPTAHVWNLSVAGVPHNDLPTDSVQWLGQVLKPPAGSAGGPLKVQLSGTATP